MTNASAAGTSTAAGGAPGRALAARWAPGLHALLRIGAGLLYMEHGLQKLFGLFGGMGPSGGNVPLASLMGLAGVLESGGGLLLVLGLFTRPVATILLLEMLYALATVHLPRGGAPIQNGGELPLLYALIWAFLAGNGAGPASLDSRRAG
jgi:putative oxidoreductase